MTYQRLKKAPLFWRPVCVLLALAWVALALYAGGFHHHVAHEACDHAHGGCPDRAPHHGHEEDDQQPGSCAICMAAVQVLRPPVPVYALLSVPPSSRGILPPALIPARSVELSASCGVRGPPAA